MRAYVSTLQKCGFSMFVVMDGTVNPAKEATSESAPAPKNARTHAFVCGVISRKKDQIKVVRQLTYSDKCTS